MDAFFGCNVFTAQLAAAAAATADVGAAVDAATKPAVAAAGEHEAVPRETGKDADSTGNQICQDKLRFHFTAVAPITNHHTTDQPVVSLAWPGLAWPMQRHASLRPLSSVLLRANRCSQLRVSGPPASPLTLQAAE